MQYEKDKRMVHILSSLPAGRLPKQGGWRADRLVGDGGCDGKLSRKRTDSPRFHGGGVCTIGNDGLVCLPRFGFRREP